MQRRFNLMLILVYCGLSLMTHAPKGFAATTTTASADCLFNWAEDQYSALFKPSRPSTLTFGDYTLRYYPQTITYLGISNRNAHLYYYAPTSSSSAMLDLGLAATWKTQAGCSQ